ncbi:unnamed protein product [Moneuplotes crassus]|uniref:RING-type domain-containing protein n=1 Tax=Euplotes crassus TaxID=5936 RepID=A0AAD1XKS3_EUPCR|nr:unnamed protein product [Moneuplotes crassus]
MKSLKAKGIVKCLSCGDALFREHDGVKCNQGHDVCTDCCKTLVENILSEPETKIPAECSLCKVKLNSVRLEMQMTPDQLEVYLMYKAMKDVDPKVDKVMSCPFCKYFEIWAKANSSNFFYCKKQDCKKGSCSVCFKEFKVPKGMAVTEDELGKMKEEGGMLTHHKCYEYKDVKEDWDKAIESGTKRCCPECKVGGIKDDACTHMICDNCNTVWCYFCGKKESDLDKSDPNGNIFKHNEDWEINDKRCPMYLTQIGQIDDRWSCDSDKEAKAFFHKLLTYKNIRNFYRKYKKREFKELCKVFISVENHGFNNQEIFFMNLTKIIRES